MLNNNPLVPVTVPASVPKPYSRPEVSTIALQHVHARFTGRAVARDYHPPPRAEYDVKKSAKPVYIYAPEHRPEEGLETVDFPLFRQSLAFAVHDLGDIMAIPARLR